MNPNIPKVKPLRTPTRPPATVEEIYIPVVSSFIPPSASLINALKFSPVLANP